MLRSPQERQHLAAAGSTDAREWSAPVLMARVVELYQRLVDERVDAVAEGA